MLALISGGGSALLAAPAAGITLAEKRAVTAALLRSGATIGEMNCVRKHLSAIKGGRLAAAAWPAPVLTLAISDVPGDDPAVIASGPTVADPTTAADALKVLDLYGIAIPDGTAPRGWRRGELETPKPGDPRLAQSEFRLIASPRQMLEAAAAKRARLGITPLILGDAIEGEAREVGRVLAGIALSCGRHGAAGRGALRAALRRRDDGDGARQRARRAQRANSCSAWRWRSTARRASTRWPPTPTASTAREDNAGAFVAPDTLAPGARAGHRRRRLPGGQRCLGLLRGARRPAGDRSDAHQRQ